MRKAFRAACIASLLFATNAYAATEASSPPEQIAPLLREMLLAANAHDTDRYLTVFKQDPSLVFVVNGASIHGWKDLRDWQLTRWHNGKSDVIYTQQGATDFMVLRSDVVVTTQTLASSRTNSYGAVRSNEIVVTSVWQQLADGWRIVVVHESTVQ